MISRENVTAGNIISVLARGLRRMANDLEALRVVGYVAPDDSEGSLAAPHHLPPAVVGAVSGKPLTERQAQALTFIVEFTRSMGYPPSVREIGKHMEIRSTNGVIDHLRALARKGFIRCDFQKSRGIAVIHAASRATETISNDDHQPQDGRAAS